MLRPAHAAYLLGAASVAVSNATSMVAGVLSVWLLARILTKEMFGGYAFAMAVVGLASVIATLGLERSLMLRIARRPAARGRLWGRGLVLRAVLASLVAAVAVALTIATLAEPLVGRGAIAEARFWLPALAIAIVPIAASTLLQSWFQANHMIGLAVLMPGLADGLRCVLFAVVVVAGLGAAGVAGAVAVAASVPVAILILNARGRTVATPRLLWLTDLRKSLPSMATRLATQGIRQVDIVMMGLLAGGAATASYAIAARLAVFSDYGNVFLKPSFTPRIRQRIASGDRPAAAREYRHIQSLGLAGALAIAAGFVIAGKPVLGILGPFRDAYGPLLILAAGYLINSGFGMHTVFLAMTGEVGWSAVLRTATLVLLIVLDFLLIPNLGALGAAIAAAVTSLTSNIFGAVLAYRLAGLRSIDVTLVAIMSGAATVLTLTALQALPSAVAAILLIFGAAVTLVRSREPLLQAGRNLLNWLRPRVR